MVAVDTNVVVRFLLADEPEQARRAKRLFESGDVFVALSVLLEAEWVMRGVYRTGPRDIVRHLRDLAGLPGITLEDPARLERALGWTEQGLDFADALHLASSAPAATFATFDEKLRRRARRANVPGVTHVP